MHGPHWSAVLLYPFFGILLSPMIASAAMSFSSVSVIANALRLREACHPLTPFLLCSTRVKSAKKSAVFLILTWLVGSFGIFVGQARDEEHKTFHAVHPNSFHAHNGHLPRKHHHNPIEKDHEPLPFELTDSQWAVCPSKIVSTPRFTIALDLLPVFKNFALFDSEKNIHWTYPESPPLHHPPSIAASHLKRAPPLV